MVSVRWLLGQSLEDFGRVKLVILLDNRDSGVAQYFGQKDLHNLRRQLLCHSPRHFELNVQKLTLVMDYSFWFDFCEKFQIKIF